MESLWNFTILEKCRSYDGNGKFQGICKDFRKLATNNINAPRVLVQRDKGCVFRQESVNMLFFPPPHYLTYPGWESIESIEDNKNRKKITATTTKKQSQDTKRAWNPALKKCKDPKNFQSKFLSVTILRFFLSPCFLNLSWIC